ncbi:MAG: glycine cleavage T C-terminal barrel domain-containing protein [Acidimicrobiales bacterium]
MTDVLDLDDGYRALREDVAGVRLPRDVVVVTGPDAVTYLQGQLSQDVAGLAVGASAWSFLLSPQGKVDAWLRLTRLDDERVVLDADAGIGEVLLARLERFKLRTKADLELQVGWSCVAVRGPRAGTVAIDRTTAVVVAPVAWPGGVVGADLVGPDPAVPVAVPLAPVEALDAVRIECGVPVVGRELHADTIPAEAGAWVIDASVSFTKGCYTGQELVARIDSRGGHVPRPVRALVLGEGVVPDHLPPVGAVVVAGDQEAGALTSVAWSPGHGTAVALAPLARAVEPPVAVEVAWEGTRRPARVVELPIT